MGTRSESLELQHQEIFELYNYAEELLSTVDSSFVTDSQGQFDLVEPLVTQLGESADILTKLFETNTRCTESASVMCKKKAETALRKIYVALEEYAKLVRKGHARTVVSLHNIADPIVHRIKRQVERIVAIFIELMHISVHLVMNKQEIEQLKQHQARVALMLHQHAQQHS